MIEGSNVNVYDSNFTDNTADLGAAMYISGKDAIVSKSLFASNIAKKWNRIYQWGQFIY